MPVFTSSIEVTADYPTIRPSLNLNFARSRALDPRITFTRASVATYVGRDGQIKTAGNNEARFDHDPETLESLGLLIEESRTNRAFGTPSAAQGGVTLGQNNSLTGTNNAILFGKNSPTAGQSNLNWGVDGTVSTTSFVFSVFVKEVNTSTFFLQLVNNPVNDNLYVYYNTSTGVTSFTDFNAPGNLTVTPSIENYTDGWYRLIVRVEGFTNGTINSAVRFGFANPSNNAQQYQNTTHEVLVYGPQLEDGAVASSLIPTESATGAVTRAKDAATILGENFNSFYNPNEWTVDFVYRIRTVEPNGSNYRLWDINNNTNDGRLGALYSANGFVSYFGFENGTTSFSSDDSGFNIIVNDEYHGALAYSPTSSIAFKPRAGVLGDEDTNVPLDGPTQLQIGDWYNDDRSMNGTIAKFVYYPKRLTNAQLLTITS